MLTEAVKQSQHTKRSDMKIFKIYSCLCIWLTCIVDTNKLGVQDHVDKLNEEKHYNINLKNIGLKYKIIFSKP